ncbi:MAG: HupE/UreJ family protein [Methylococcaceae bacterium]|nr:HupE/UreJ family protein [Methylococcaceae bacterium]
MLKAVVLLTVVLGCELTQAHPVSQGAMTITVQADHIDVLATVSLEELLVASAWSKRNSKPGPEALGEHGDYLLKHLHVTADGRSVNGRVVETPSQTKGPLRYRLDYPLVAATLKQLTFRQDVLREFPFAPGNPWEASYIVRIGVAEQPASEGLLFTYREALVFEHDGAGGLNRPGLMNAYVRHGIAHILTGYDHLLFVAALVLAVAGWKDLFKVIAVFTLAHTLTLALAVLNIIRLPVAVVEPMIAASIVTVAMQNIFWPTRSLGGARLLVAFGFGLFHGLGFAGGLLDAMSAMAHDGMALAMVAFSIGIEIGHMMVVLPVFGGLALLRNAHADKPTLSSGLQRYGSAIISFAGLVYFYHALQ